MSNNLTSNITRKVARIFLEKFEASRALTKTVDTQLLSGKFTPSSGSNVDFKRPHDYNTIRTSGGDISSSTKSDIIAGKATGTVQDYLTVATEWGNVEEALELDQLDKILAPMATRIVTDLELSLGEFMLNNGGLSYGSPGTAVSAWSHVAGASAFMTAMGVPQDGNWHYTMNPFTQVSLADKQTSLSGSDSAILTAWEKATIRESFAGFRVMSSNALKSRTSSATGGDRAGAVASVGASTYAAHKDTMIQTVNVDGFTGSFTVKAGEIVEVTGKYHLSLATREQIIGSDGAPVKFRGVVTADATITAGAGTLLVAGPAIYEANGQYNTVNAALADGDVITLLGADSTIYQPNLFYHKQAFGLGTVKLPKLYSTDTVATTEDGMSIRISRYADGDANKQMVRFDLLPAFACFNPFLGGQAFGVA